MKSPTAYFTALLLLCSVWLNAQVLEIEHSKILVDTIPFKFTGSPSSKTYARYREIRIGCLNTGRNDLLITGASQCFTNDTSWLKAADNVKFPNIIKAGSYGTIVITYSTSSPFEKIKISSNSKTGAQVITLIDTYKDPLDIKRNMSDYPAKLREGDVAIFSSLIYNNGTKKITIDSVSFPDTSLKMRTKLPLTILPGKNEPLSLSANTKGKMNFYYGGTPVFFYHEEKGYENFAKQEFSCIVVPFIQLLEKDTFSFGNVKRGTIVTQTFHYVNKGSFDLETGKNTSECISYDKPLVKPGESFAVTIKFNTTVADSGKIMREFAVLLPPFFYTNSVYMKGVIIGPAAAKSEFLQSDDRVIECAPVSNDTARSVTRKIRIKNNSGLPIVITNVTVEGAYAFSDAKTTIAPGEYFNIKFVYPTKNIGYFDKLINISYATRDCSNGEFYYQLEIKGNVIAK
jgi:hypothetical protein